MLLMKSSAITSPENIISDDEKAVYDRQIRLWGLETQNKSVDPFIILLNFHYFCCYTENHSFFFGIYFFHFLNEHFHNWKII